MTAAGFAGDADEAVANVELADAREYYDEAIVSTKAAQDVLKKDAARDRLWDRWTRRAKTYPRVAVVLALIAVGIGLLVNVLVVLAYYGVFVDPLRQFWYWWPTIGVEADLVKVVSVWGAVCLVVVTAILFRRREPEPPL